ncbi:MAG: hypothetical protein AAGE84_10565 [Cyanobacteria bacterium P01_G01_bin.39]
MTSATLKLANNNLEMALLQAAADSFTSNELYVWLSDSGLPTQIATRLHELVTYTKKAGKKVFAVGKIILIKIIEFVKVHRNLVTGIGIGLTIGLAVQTLVSSIPFIGAVLAPVAGAMASKLGITIFGILGHGLDKKNQGRQMFDDFFGVPKDMIEITKDFFEFIADTFNTIFHQVITA